MNAQARIRGWITRDPLAAAFVILTVPIYAAAVLVTPLLPWGGFIATILVGGWAMLALLTGLQEQRRQFQGVTAERPRSRLERAVRFVSFVVPCGLWIYGFILQRSGATETWASTLRDGALSVLIVTHVVWIVLDWTLQQRFNARSTAP